MTKTEFTKLARGEAEQVVADFRYWEIKHNRDNYGRYDAYADGRKAGFDQGAASVKEEVVALLTSTEGRERFRVNTLSVALVWLMSKIAEREAGGEKSE